METKHVFDVSSSQKVSLFKNFLLWIRTDYLITIRAGEAIPFLIIFLSIKV